MDVELTMTDCSSDRKSDSDFIKRHLKCSWSLRCPRFWNCSLLPNPNMIYAVHSVFILMNPPFPTPPPPKDPKHRRSSQEVSRHHRSSEASGAGSGPLQGGIREVASRGGEADDRPEGRWDGQIVQREEHFWPREVRVKYSVTSIPITRAHLGVLRKPCPSIRHGRIFGGSRFIPICSIYKGVIHET